MCLTVDYEKEIYDEKEYTFYKAYAKNRYGVLISPFKRVLVTNHNLIAKTPGGNNLPAKGQTAYNKHAREIEISGNCRGFLHVGLHAYINKEDATNLIEMEWAEVVWTVKVKGKHIIAFGDNGDVVFTRGRLSKAINWVSNKPW